MDSEQLFGALQYLNRKNKNKFSIGVYAAYTIPPRFITPAAFIANTDDKGKSGTHWVAFFITVGGKIEFFDSYGLPPLAEGHCSFLSKRSWTCNDKELQSLTSTVCGHYCLMYLASRMNGFKLKDFQNLFSNDLALNDTLVYTCAENMLKHKISRYLAHQDSLTRRCKHKMSWHQRIVSANQLDRSRIALNPCEDFHPIITIGKPGWSGYQLSPDSYRELMKYSSLIWDDWFNDDDRKVKNAPPTLTLSAVDNLSFRESYDKKIIAISNTLDCTQQVCIAKSTWEGLVAIDVLIHELLNVYERMQPEAMNLFVAMATRYKEIINPDDLQKLPIVENSASFKNILNNFVQIQDIKIAGEVTVLNVPIVFREMQATDLIHHQVHPSLQTLDDPWNSERIYHHTLHRSYLYSRVPLRLRSSDVDYHAQQTVIFCPAPPASRESAAHLPPRGVLSRTPQRARPV
ncbi:hypothetical protein B566_EDAN018056, partial [Ephemera danica]